MIIYSGSEVGALREFLGLDGYKSPPYGRAREAINVERFPKDESIEFSEAGFSEGINAPKDLLEKVVKVSEPLDSRPCTGILLLGENPNLLDRVIEEAVKVSMKIFLI